MLVTESVRLDIYKKGRDSLMGRYFPYRLHPFIYLCLLLGMCNKSYKVKKITLGTGHTGFRVRLIIDKITFYTAPKAVANFNHNLYDDLGRMQEANTLDKRRIRKASSKSSITDVIFLVICLKSICLIDPTPSAR